MRKTGLTPFAQFSVTLVPRTSLLSKQNQKTEQNLKKWPDTVSLGSEADDYVTVLSLVMYEYENNHGVM